MSDEQSDEYDSSESEYSSEEFIYEIIPEEYCPEIKTRNRFVLNCKKFSFVKYADFIPKDKVSQEVDIGDIIHIIHRSNGYCYVQCIVDYVDAEYASVHRIDTTGYAERTYKFSHSHFLIFKMPTEYWKSALTHQWSGAIKQLSLDSKDSRNELVNE